MTIKEAYDTWSLHYDTDNNKTRDLEAFALRSALADLPFQNCLEIGCGTGKNTEWLATRAKNLTAIDISEKMMAKAREKIISYHVQFIHADITKEWTFISKKYDLISFSLILEHIENLDEILHKASDALAAYGYIYIGELHPFKQYSGSKAKFENKEGVNILESFTHHLSDYTAAAERNNFEIIELNEVFDNNDRSTIPRLLTLILKSKK